MLEKVLDILRRLPLRYNELFLRKFWYGSRSGVRFRRQHFDGEVGKRHIRVMQKMRGGLRGVFVLVWSVLLGPLCAGALACQTSTGGTDFGERARYMFVQNARAGSFLPRWERKTVTC